ncbi:PREDICTED: aromatic-L-amino-acid decarboxylase-like [Branchiostoma belcheri]|uniref:Aromatic-L-amino-acid decarboxylase-like n=1 Tax=Branchiostoma belcheri TaxID=7741 RepID=A0A6P4ZSQ9_BRABE|nr:PREDICTED: aromatic-L-amino-acid decarboxylase-like [Branchiostoma belcheri]
MATSEPTCNQEGIQELREELEVLRTTSSVLDPGQDVRSAWTGSVLEVVTRQTETPQDAGAKVRPAAESEDAAAPGCLRQHGLDEGPADIDTVLQVYRQSVLGTGENALHPGYFAYIPTGGLYPAALGDFLAAACGTYTGAYPLCPGGVEMENMLITWLAALLGYPQGHAGNISSGGTMATITALATARDSAGIKAADFHRCVLYGSTLLHHSAEKALQAVGMAEATVRKVPVDAEFRMNVFSLEQQIMQDKEAGLLPFVVVATVGTTDVGSVDPVDAIADVCRRHAVWLHVDGAYGGFFALVDDVKHLFRGVGRSDSVVLNPHKGLFVPCGTGVLIVREGGKLLRCCSSHRLGNYYSCLQLSHTELSPCQLSFEQTRHFRGPRLWLPLKLYGIAAFRAALREKLLLARYFYQRLKETGLFELPLKPQLSVVVFRYATPPGEDTEYHNQRLLAAILSDGRVYLTPTTVGGAFFLRVCVLHFRSHLEHVDLCLTIIKQAAERICNGG